MGDRFLFQYPVFIRKKRKSVFICSGNPVESCTVDDLFSGYDAWQTGSDYMYRVVWLLLRNNADGCQYGISYEGYPVGAFRAVSADAFVCAGVYSVVQYQ